MAERPIALGLTVCDQIIIEKGTEKVSLIGTFDKLNGPAFPLTQPFGIYATLTNGLGAVTIRVEVSRLDTGDEVYSLETPTHFPDKLTDILYILRVRTCEFPEPGIYQVTLFADGEWLAQKRIQLSRKGGEL